MAKVIRRDMNHSPTEPGQRVSPSEVSFEFRAISMVDVAVVLDRELRIRVRDVDASDDLLAFVHLELQRRQRQPGAFERPQQPAFLDALGRLACGIPSGEEFPHDADTSPASAREIVETRLHQRQCDQAAAFCVVECFLDLGLRRERTEVEERSCRCCRGNAANVGEVARRKLGRIASVDASVPKPIPV